MEPLAGWQPHANGVSDAKRQNGADGSEPMTRSMSKAGRKVQYADLTTAVPIRLDRYGFAAE